MWSTNKMTMVRLSFEEQKITVKWWFKYENVVEVHGQWKLEFTIDPLTCLTTAHIHDNFEERGTVCNLSWRRSGRSCTAASPTSSTMMLEHFTRSSQKSIKQCACETGVSRTSIQYFNQQNEKCTFLNYYMYVMKMTMIEDCSFMSCLYQCYVLLSYYSN